MMRLSGVRSRSVVPLLVSLLSLLALGSSAESATVIIDDFAGNIRGTRTVNLLPPPGTSTTPQGTFVQSGGVATMTMTGNGNGQGGVELVYNFGATDLTDGGNNKQFFLEFTQLQRTGGEPWESAISITLRATDSGGTTGYYNLGAGSQSPFNIVLNFACPPENPTCPKFEPPPNFTTITSVAAYMVFPSSHSGTDFTTAVLDVIRATPEGGAPPTPPYPSITAGSDPDCSAPVRFNVSFGANVAGFAADDLVMGGTAPGPRSASVAGGPADYTVDVSGMTGTGTVSLQIPANRVLDTWGQGNVASATVTTTFGSLPAITSASGSTFLVGAAGSFTVTATGAPAPAITHQSGSLPGGLSFSSPTLAGTASAGTGGSYPIVFAATNGCGAVTQNHTVAVNQASAITSAGATTFTVGAPGSFTVTATGHPAPTLSVSGSLPSGVTFVPATGVLSGTPATGTGGSYPLTFTATNGIGSPAEQSFTLTVSQAPAITSASATTFTVGAAGSFTVTATGYPAPTLSVSGSLPSGVSFVPATGVLSGTPAAGTGGTYALTFHAVNGVSPDLHQGFTLTVNEASAITSTDATTFTIAASNSFTVAVSGYPVPTVGVTGSLPSGVSFVPATRVLSGSPAAGTNGSYPLAFTATNGIGTPAQQDFTLTVAKAGTTTTVSGAPNPSVFGQTVTTSYSVTANPPASGTPSGNVTVSDGVNSCNGTVAAGGCSLLLVGAGTHTLTATYSGDTAFLGSVGTSPHTVNKAATTTTITGHTPDPSGRGSSVTVSFGVDVSAPGAGTPTGTATVGDGVDSCSATVAAGSCALTLTTAGNRTLTASYAGDANFETSATAAGTPHVVVAPPSLAKSFAVASVPVGLVTRLTLTLANDPSNTVALTGVGFSDDFPAGLVVADPSLLTSYCGGLVQGLPGESQVSLTGATLNAGQSCAVLVDVVGTSVGTKLNVTAAVTSANGGDGNSASASLEVTGAAPPQSELSHGFEWTGSLEARPGPAQREHVFALVQDPYASYEVVVDAVSGDVQPLVVERLASDGSLLATALPTGVGSSRSLRWTSLGTSPVGDEVVRVRSGGCTTGCGPQDVFRLRFYETTLGMARFNNTGSQVTVLIVQNATEASVSGSVYFWAEDGSLLTTAPLTLAAHGVAVLPTAATGSGSVSITHDAPYGAVAAKAVIMDPATGYTFDSPAEPRPR